MALSESGLAAAGVAGGMVKPNSKANVKKANTKGQTKAVRPGGKQSFFVKPKGK